VDQEQAGREQYQQNEVKIANAPEAIELEKKPDQQQRREIHPRRRMNGIIVEQELAHSATRCVGRSRRTSSIDTYGDG
jgi:hypothetical protein